MIWTNSCCARHCTILPACLPAVERDVLLVQSMPAYEQEFNSARSYHYCVCVLALYCTRASCDVVQCTVCTVLTTVAVDSACARGLAASG